VEVQGETQEEVQGGTLAVKFAELVKLVAIAAYQETRLVISRRVAPAMANCLKMV